MPHSEDIRDSAASSFANINQIEHFQHGSASGIGDAAAFGPINFNAEATRVGKRNAVFLFNNYQSLPPIVS